MPGNGILHWSTRLEPVPLVDVVKAAGLKSPFEDGCVKEAAEVSKEWCLAHQLKK